ncbi:RNA polymerase sigma factor [Aestuariibaculum suncheonense]|uniref:RNA polymerase sigma factor n=1 Tax=Aestuariibaculum suncheonense TaxID=1028745 RepID=A0A8J6QW79_9FLAO|nr:RNA polymerase sigma factor [Aestuariibaculum suncheonense]
MNEEINISFKAIKEGDKKVFEKLYSEYFPKLFLFLRAYTNDDTMAEDVVQDVFIKIWNKRKQLSVKTSLNSYLYKIAYTTLMDKHRHLKKDNNMLSSYYYTALILSAEKGKNLRDQQLTNLDKCINELPDRCREVFYENKIKGRKYAEVATTFEITIKTVEAHVAKAFKILRDCMKGEF